MAAIPNDFGWEDWNKTGLAIYALGLMLVEQRVSEPTPIALGVAERASVPLLAVRVVRVTGKQQ